MTDGEKQRATGEVEEIKGKIVHAWGEVTGDRSTQAKGKIEEMKGKARKNFGKAQERVDDSDEQEYADDRSGW